VLFLLKKAKNVFLIALGVYVVCIASGYIAGKAEWVDFENLKDSSVIKLSRNLEKHVPGYGHLIEEYKAWHNELRNKYLFDKDSFGMGKLIFLNNWIVANLTMIIRTVFVAPLILIIPGKFFQGVAFAQIPESSRLASVFFLEFGGYFVVICATLCLVLWTVFFKFFKFATRISALLGGLKLLGLAYLFSALTMLIGSILETKFIMNIFKQIG
jgi:hypothetical protein